MSAVASYRAAYAHARMLGTLYAIIALLAVLLFAGAIAFDDMSDTSGRREWTFGLVIAFVVISPALPPLLTRATHEWRLHPDHLEISERPLVPLLLARRHASLPFESLSVVRSTEGLVGIRHIELEDDSGRRFRLAPKVEGGPGNWKVDSAGFNAFIAGVRAATEARRGPLRSEPMPVFWATVPGVVTIALFLLVPVGTTIAAAWIFLVRGEIAGLGVAAGSLALSGVVYAWLRTSWRACQARLQR